MNAHHPLGLFMNRLRLIFCKNTQFYLYIEISSVLFSFFAVFLLSLQSKSYKEPMILENISIINYKNIKGVNLDLSPKINCLIGHNGVGKTNFWMLYITSLFVAVPIILLTLRLSCMMRISLCLKVTIAQNRVI